MLLELFLCSTLYAAKPIKIAVLDFRPKVETMAKWLPLETYINQQIPEHNFSLETYQYDELEDAIAKHQVDFVLTQPAHYILMESQYNLSSPLATLIKKKGGYDLSVFGGVIFTRSERTDISNLADIKQKTIAVPSTHSLGAFQMQAMALHSVGINVNQDVVLNVTGMPHDTAVAAVLNKQADIGFVRTGVLESLVKEGKLDFQQLKIINEQHNDRYLHFPLVSSTRLYPEWAFAVLPHVDNNISRQVAAVLFGLKHNGTLAKSIDIVGFTIPTDYKDVRKLLLTLRLPPYDAAPEFTFIDIWHKYNRHILLIVGLISFIIVLLLFWQKVKNSQNLLFRHLFDQHNAMILLLDSDNKCIKGSNASAAQFFDYSEKALEGLPISQFFPHYSGSEKEKLDVLLNNGSAKTVQVQTSSSSFNKQNVELIIFQDITGSVQIKIRNALHTLVMQKLVEGAPLKTILDAILIALEENNKKMLCSILLMSSDGKRLLTGSAPSLPDFYTTAVNNLAIGPGVGSCGTAAFTRKRVIVEDIANHPYWAPFTELTEQAGLGSCWSEPIFGTDNTLLGTFAIYHAEPCAPTTEDFQLIEYVTLLTAIAIERSKTAEQLKLSSRVFSDTHEGITITDAYKNIIEVNPAFSVITGYERSEVIGENPRILSSGQQGAEFYKKMWKVIEAKGYWQGEVWNRKKTGELYAELLTISSLKDSSDQVVNYVVMFTDITHSKQQQEKLNLMAHYDVLTKLPNRALFVDRFKQAIAHSKRIKTQLAVCFLDLDNFKPINDNFGHEVGDQLLIQVANRISACIREEDTISRQGGDEFALLLGDINSFSQCDKTLKRILDSLAKTYHIKGKEHRITASCGVTIYPDDNGDIDTLVRHADQAMYKAKQLGRNKYQLFNATLDKEDEQKQHRLDEIKHALENNELVLYYQPKVNMRTGGIYGAEALIRWIHPEKGLIPPLDFLPVIDGTELEIDIGNWVINQAMQQISTWHKQGIKLQVSVNIASYHLQSNDFFNCLKELFERYPEINSSLLQLEILESSVLGDVTTIANIINRCQTELGVSVALDDFGTGYSSLTHLRNLPANIIKIDQSFVRDVLDDPNDYTIIDGIIKLAESFNRSVIAEGVETVSHGIVLLNMGCDYAQGYGIAKPMPAEQLENWLSSYQANQIWIDFAAQDSSKVERRIRLMKLVSRHWQVKFTEKIFSPHNETSDWPLIESRKCHCGHWIQQVKKEDLFDNEWIEQLDIAHKKVHSFAKILQLSYEENNEVFNKEKLAEFNMAVKEMENIFSTFQ